MADTKTKPDNAFDSAAQSREDAIAALKSDAIKIAKAPAKSDAPKTETNGDKE